MAAYASAIRTHLSIHGTAPRARSGGACSCREPTGSDYWPEVSSKGVKLFYINYHFSGPQVNGLIQWARSGCTARPRVPLLFVPGWQLNISSGWESHVDISHPGAEYLMSTFLIFVSRETVIQSRLLLKVLYAASISVAFLTVWVLSMSSCGLWQI